MLLKLNATKKVLSFLLLAAILVSCFQFNTALTANAIITEVDDHYAYDYVVPVIDDGEVDNSNMVLSVATMNSYWSSSLSAAPVNLPNGGVRFGFTNSASVRVYNAINQTFDVDGLSVKLANIGDGTEVKSQHFAINLSSSNVAEYNTGNTNTVCIGVNGRLGIVDYRFNGTTVNIVENGTADATTIKENIGGKTVYIDFAKVSDDSGDYTVTIIMGDKTVSGIIPASVMNAAAFAATGKCYVGLAACAINNGTNATVDFLGVGNLNVHKTTEYNIPSITTDDVNGNMVLSAATMNSYWSSSLSAVPVNLSDGGVRFGFTSSASVRVYNAINQTFDVDGLSVKLANIGDGTEVKSQHFAINLSSSSAAEYNAGNTNTVCIGVNGRLGTVEYRFNGTTVNIVENGTADATTIKENIGGKTVYIDFEKVIDDSGDYTVSIIMGDKTVSGTIPASVMNAAAFAATGKCYVGLAALAITNGTNATVDFLGVGNFKATNSYYDKEKTEVYDTDSTDLNACKNSGSGYERLESFAAPEEERDIYGSATSVSPKNVRVQNFEAILEYKITDTAYGGVGIGFGEAWAGQHKDFSVQNSNVGLQSLGATSGFVSATANKTEEDKSNNVVDFRFAGEIPSFNGKLNCNYSSGDTFKLRVRLIGTKLTVDLIKKNLGVLYTFENILSQPVAKGAISFYCATGSEILGIQLTELDTDGTPKTISKYNAGDISGDGVIDTDDAKQVQQLLLGNGKFKCGMDANEDLKFDIVDLVRININLTAN